MAERVCDREWWVSAKAAQPSRVGPFPCVTAAANFVANYRSDGTWSHVMITSKKKRVADAAS